MIMPGKDGAKKTVNIKTKDGYYTTASQNFDTKCVGASAAQKREFMH